MNTGKIESWYWLMEASWFNQNVDFEQAGGFHEEVFDTPTRFLLYLYIKIGQCIICGNSKNSGIS